MMALGSCRAASFASDGKPIMREFFFAFIKYFFLNQLFILEQSDLHKNGDDTENSQHLKLAACTCYCTDNLF